jgi:hypothetical protein
MGKKLKRKRSHHGPAETGPRPRAALPHGAIIYISYDELRDHGVPWTRVHLNRLIEQGLFPAPHQLSTNRIAWTLDDLERWKASRPLARVPGVKGAAPQATAQQAAPPQTGKERAKPMMRGRAPPHAKARPHGLAAKP